MPDSIFISDLELWTRLGVPAEERQFEQRVLVSVEMFLDTHAAAAGDDVSQSVNYEIVVNEIHELAQTERKTIERLAQDIADVVLKHKAAESVKVTVQKHIMPGTQGASVTIMRS